MISFSSMYAGKSGRDLTRFRRAKQGFLYLRLRYHDRKTQVWKLFDRGNAETLREFRPDKILQHHHADRCLIPQMEDVTEGVMMAHRQRQGLPSHRPPTTSKPAQAIAWPHGPSPVNNFCGYGHYVPPPPISKDQDCHSPSSAAKLRASPPSGTPNRAIGEVQNAAEMAWIAGWIPVTRTKDFKNSSLASSGTLSRTNTNQALSVYSVLSGQATNQQG